MANGRYPQSGRYRGDDQRVDREYDRRRPDYGPGDTGYVQRPDERQHRGERYSGDPHMDRGAGGPARSSRYGRGEEWASDEFGYDRGYADTDHSQTWARESYRGRPSSYSYEPGRHHVNQAFGDYYGADYGADDNPGYGNHGPERERRDSRRGFIERAGDEVASWFGDEQAQQRRYRDQHRGKGPKGYQRSDARIEEDVNDRLSDDPVLDASNITVTVKEAEVTLDGSVSSRWDKRRAEDLVDDVSGVRHVQNNLRISNEPASRIGGSTTA